MAIYRLYTGADRQSHIEETTLAEHPELGELEPLQGITLKRRGDERMEFHPAPERRWLVVVSGTIEIDPGNGDARRFSAGDMVRITDTTGRGHGTTFIDDPVFAVLPIADQSAP